MCGVMLSGSEESTPSIIYHCVLRGLERLLLSEQLCRLDAESLVKLSVDRVNVHSPHRAMAALGLMLTCMYTGELWGPRDWPRPTRAWQVSDPGLQATWASCLCEREAFSFLGHRPWGLPGIWERSRVWDHGVMGSRSHCCTGFIQSRAWGAGLQTDHRALCTWVGPWAAESSLQLASQHLPGFVELL